MRKILLAASLLAANLAIAAALPSPVRAEEQQKKFDYDWAYDPLTHQPILVCVDCWFWSCDCGST